MWVDLIPFTVLALWISTSAGQSPLQIEIEKGILSGDSAQSGPNKFNTIIPDGYRLPRTVIPTKYNVKIIPMLEEETFEGAQQWTAAGDVTISLNCVENTTSIVLHAHILTITDPDRFVSVTYANDSTKDPVKIGGFTREEEKHFFIINLEENLIAGQPYEVFLRFSAQISNYTRTDGLYRSFYQDPLTDTTRWLAATQMQAVHNREMFPCMDEPDLKAVFEISIGRKSTYKTWANTEITRTADISGLPGWVWDIYAPTVPMSTYLVAILVAEDYGCSLADSSLYNKPVQVCAPNYIIAKEGALYGAETAAKHMKFFEEYFENEYKLSKIDSASLPHFGGGAMENWGLNLYRESYLLYLEGETTEAERSVISEVLGHELVHQWFGNLVTGKWWSELWLNEGFATYFSYIASNHTDPEFETLTGGFLNNFYQYSMAFASRWDYGHPVLQAVETPTEIDLMFDRMAYEKAGSLIRMMEGFLTEPTLRMALVNYLRNMEYKGAEQDDLFSALTIRAHADRTLPLSLTVKEIMDTWTMKKSFPLVRVSRSGQNKLIISQEPFRNNDDMGLKGERFPVQNNLADLWYVPVALITEDNPVVANHVPKFWIERTTSAKTYDHDTQKWILINPDAYGYYRVLYDAPLTLLLHKQLTTDHSVISPMSRSQLLDDYFNLAFQKYISIESALQFTQYLEKETSIVVWSTVVTNLRKTYAMISGTTAFSGFRNYFLPRLSSSLENIGLEQITADKGAVVIHRSQILDWMCAMENASCVEYAERLFDSWMNNPSVNRIPVDLQPVVYCSAVASKGESAFNFAFEQYKTNPLARQKTLLLNAMACSKDISLINTLLEYTLNPSSGLQRSHFITALQRISMNPLGRNSVIRFLNSNIASIITEFEGATPIANVISTLSSYLNTKEELETLKLFITSNAELSTIEASLNVSVANVETNIKWMESFFSDIKNWFDAQTQ